MRSDRYMVASCTIATSPDRKPAKLGVNLPTGDMVRPQNVPADGTTFMRNDQTVGLVGSPVRPHA